MQHTDVKQPKKTCVRFPAVYVRHALSTELRPSATTSASPAKYLHSRVLHVEQVVVSSHVQPLPLLQVYGFKDGRDAAELGWHCPPETSTVTFMQAMTLVQRPFPKHIVVCGKVLFGHDVNQRACGCHADASKWPGSRPLVRNHGQFFGTRAFQKHQ